MGKTKVAIGIIFSLCFCAAAGILVFNSKVDSHNSSSLIVRTIPGSVTRNLTSHEIIGIKNINGVPVSLFKELQSALGKIEKSKSVNIDYHSMQNPEEVVLIATPSADPTSTSDFYSALDLGIFPGESLIHCLKKGSVFAELNLEANDIVILINNRPFNDILAAGSALLPSTDKIQVSVLRKGQIINLEKVFPQKMTIESIKDLGYLPPSPRYELSGFPWIHFTSSSFFLNLKGYACGEMQ